MDETEAATVRRIFENYAAGASPRKIAWLLNEERTPGPTGGIWYDTVIRGRPSRGDGILRNELYVGRVLWNRLRNSKDPVAGTRVRRANAAAQFVTKKVPELAIVDQDTWQRVQGRLLLEATGMAEPTESPKTKF